MKIKALAILSIFIFCICVVQAQQKKNITLDDIWIKPIWQQKSVNGVNWMANGKFYSTLENNNIEKYDITSGQKVETIVDGNTLITDGEPNPIEIEEYVFSKDEKKVLISTQTEPIYRRSSKSIYFVYDILLKKLSPLSKGGKQSYATFSPDGKQVAFCRNNNIFLVNLEKNTELPVTNSGVINKIIHGSTDWVYEEEFEFAQAFFWSPDSKKIAFYTFDESKVPEYNMQKWGKLYPKDYIYKYPKAGEKNSKVDVSVYDILTGKTLTFNLNSEADQYIARVKWTKDPNLLSIRRMNRLQNTLEVIHGNATTGNTTVALTETSKTYIDINDDLTYLSNGTGFIHASESNGFKHLYHYNMSGSLIAQITSGNWEVDKFLGINEANKTLYFTSTEVSPDQRQLYAIKLNGKGKKALSSALGVHNLDFSPDFSYYLDVYSSAMIPSVTELRKGDGTLVKTLEDNKELKENLKNYNLSKKEFFTFKTSENVELHAWTIKPPDFDSTKKYPVFMYCYGGPGHQTVMNSWAGPDFFWFQMLAQKGYIIVSVDGRGTGAKGEAFKKSTYAQLGKLECIDQIEAAKFLGGKKYVDKSRIGIFGWSFGGYLTSLCMTLGADFFKTGIAVAPVTNWRFYDSIYTERFLKTPQENAAGYDENSPVTHAAKLKGNYLLVHGTGDDNVHFQNAVAMQDALVKANKQFTSFYYPNRNHGIYGGNTRMHLYTMMTNYIEKNL